MGILSKNLVMGILSKNLVKSLSNFKYLCRNSYSINPSLYIPKRYAHDDNNHHHLNLLLRRLHGSNNGIHYFSSLSTEKNHNFSPKDLHLPFHEIAPYPFNVVGSCNGVLCLKEKGNVVLWNPLTQEFKFLPQSFVERPPEAAYTNFSCSGFGFDPKSEDYKVVRFIENVFTDEDGSFRDMKLQVELYSLKSDSWKEISVPEPYPCSDRSPYINGIFYWIAVGRTNDLGRTEDMLILSFDFANEKFSSLLFPKLDKLLSELYTFDLLEFDGLLAVIFYPILGTKKSFDLWVMKESWTREFLIHLSDAERPLGFWKKDELFFEGINRELLMFDHATREMKHLGIFDYPETMQLIPYVESSVSLNVKSELEELDIENKEAEMAIEQQSPPTEEMKIDLFEDNDEFEIDKEWEEKEES